MSFFTLSYSYTTQGWPSFYSYEPDYMVGMNNYFYSFSGGNLYRHNSDSVQRNSFYGSTFGGIPASVPSSIRAVFNQSPLENKIFKTLNLESDQAWSATAFTDINPAGASITIDADWFEQKEGAFFANLRFTNITNPDPFTPSYPLRNHNGIGATDITITGPAGASVVQFPVGVDIDSILSIGDNFYFALNPVAPNVGVNTLTLMGTVILINRNLRQVTVNATAGTVPVLGPGVANAFFAYIKNQVAESYGALGHYLVFTLQNSSPTATELFAVESEVMKSNP